MLGGGIAGLATALVMGRRGHEVVLLERDRRNPAFSDPEEVFESRARPGIAQFRQPHNVLGLGRRLLRDHLPDVHRALLDAGTVEVEQFRFIPDGSRRPGDDELATIACRRPLFDAVLERALEAEPTVDRRHGARVGRLVVSSGRAPRVRGVVLYEGEEVTGDLIVDCLGRTTKVPAWLADEGLMPPSQCSSNCGLVYYSQHFRWRDGVEMPSYASPLGGPRGDLGYLAFAVFVGDNRTFSLCIMTAPNDRDLRAVRRSDAFLRIAERLPSVGPWVDPACAQPITPVLPMGRVHNVLRRYVRDGQPVAPGLWPVGDALSHTNPTFAFGASLALWHAVALADAVDDAADETSLARLLDAVVGEDAAHRYEAVSAEDRDRARLWAGEALDVTDRTATMPLYLRSVVYRAAPADPVLLRAVARRIDLLEGPDVLARDEELLLRAEEIFKAMRAAGEIPRGPGRAELLSVIPR